MPGTLPPPDRGTVRCSYPRVERKSPCQETANRVVEKPRTETTSLSGDTAVAHQKPQFRADVGVVEVDVQPGAALVDAVAQRVSVDAEIPRSPLPVAPVPKVSG